MSLKKTLLRLFLGSEKAEAMRVAKIVRSPDRIVLVDAYLPAFARAGGRILWVGCQAYTADYPARLEAGGGEVWTLELIRPRRSGGGRGAIAQAISRRSKRSSPTRHSTRSCATACSVSASTRRPISGWL